MAAAGVLVRSTSGKIALAAPGYWYHYPLALHAVAVSIYGEPKQLTDADWTTAQNLHLNGTTADAARIDGLPALIPLTVEGASEDFITSTMQQVVINTNTVGSQLSAVGSVYRDQVKTHVTNEADRVIASA